MVGYSTGRRLSTNRLSFEIGTDDHSVHSNITEAVQPLELAFMAQPNTSFETESVILESTNISNTDLYSATTDDVAEAGIYPRIVINDAIGPAGSQNFASPFSAVIALALGCTGTLIAPNAVITARHCGPSPGGQILFGPDSSNPIYTATIATATNPAGGGSLLDGGDVSIVTLTEDVPFNIAEPMRFSEETTGLVGQVAVTVGYGANGIGSQGHNGTSDGLRWGGTNVIDAFGTPASASGMNIISTDFDDGSAAANTISGSDLTPLEFEATTAPGDSGGPILVNQDGEWLIAGVLSGGTNPNSLYGDISWWTGTTLYQSQIEAVGGEFGPSTPEEDEHSNFPDISATVLEFDSIPIARDKGVIGIEDDLDVFRFQINNDSRVIVDAVSVRGFDPYLELFNDNGEVIASNNDKPGSRSSQISMELNAGTYYASVGSNGAASTGRFRVAVRHNGPRDDYGNKFSNASSFMLDEIGNTRIEGTIDTETDIDMLRFVADRSGDIVFRTKALSGGLNTVLRIYDANRDRIVANNNWNNSKDSRVLFNTDQGSTYFVQLGGVGGTTGDYRILAIPKTDRSAPGRLNAIDLNMPSAPSVEDLLKLEIAKFDAVQNMVAANDLNKLTEFGPQPVGLIANGLG